MELVFLGTGSGVPSKERNVSAIALKLLQEQNSIWLFDCGEATQHQILRTNIKPRKITKIFITHMHGDHIFGLPGLLSSRSFQGGEDRLTVYGPEGIKNYIETSMAVSGTTLTYPLSIVEFKEGQLLDDDQFMVTCKQLDHGIPSFGFRIIEKDRPGRLLVDKLKKDGVEPGPVYQQIKENETVQLSDGRVIHRRQYIGPDKQGRVITILGDTRATEAARPLAENADVLVHEATFGTDRAALATDYFHSTTQQAATLARDSGAKKLVLTHISSRYQDGDDAQLADEAKAIFSETELAYDFYQTIIESK
ncbi:ribonuclease Z [Lentibacillus cibarius]|uniref:Ribonuclease Z n=1 Tax=Lentibacillus cibarius TaxID=2583219 RepID=A0A5S3QHU8_9BACI|nr:ribonuclease Z [Lentibacillus cibarius]TMN20751.1 ribonuclease Z [Lentibacillus cibarius]